MPDDPRLAVRVRTDHVRGRRPGRPCRARTPRARHSSTTRSAAYSFTKPPKSSSMPATRQHERGRRPARAAASRPAASSASISACAGTRPDLKFQTRRSTPEVGVEQAVARARARSPRSRAGARSRRRPATPAGSPALRLIARDHAVVAVARVLLLEALDLGDRAAPIDRVASRARLVRRGAARTGEPIARNGWRASSMALEDDALRPTREHGEADQARRRDRDARQAQVAARQVALVPRAWPRHSMSASQRRVERVLALHPERERAVRSRAGSRSRTRRAGRSWRSSAGRSRRSRLRSACSSGRSA